tara:strand:+ start:23 stop:205 length:183 start_codon:yes stop_codon:yes gene_type:complete
MIDTDKYDLKYYRTLRDGRQRHVNDLQRVFDLVNSQLHMAKLNLEAVEDRIMAREIELEE